MNANTQLDASTLGLNEQRLRALAHRDTLETCSLDQLRDVQLRRLRWSLKHAWRNVPWYHHQFEAQGLHPEDLQQLEDLARFPFIGNAELQHHYPFELFAVPAHQVVRLQACNDGSARSPVIGYTRNDQEVWAALVARSLRAAGAHAGDRLYVLGGQDALGASGGIQLGAERLNCALIPLAARQAGQQVRLLCDFQPQMLIATPSHLLALANELERQNIAASALSLRMALIGPQPCSSALRQELEQRLGIQTLALYGVPALMDPGIGMECLETRDGVTLWEDHFYPEIIDPDSGTPLPDGSFGEVVLTSLSREALPMIRYRTGDIGRLLPGTARSMRRLERLTGNSATTLRQSA
ncbi:MULTISPECIES: AMP-binding protein [Pseudomonas]|uniref:Phenylacetate-coenzyme A ligase n=1 Tax=Pseudomonas donghuensis TaxID=1163398 RepID=A0AAP0SI24_9PSED|nr:MULTISPECIES: AMP-binding protein [Pseudomonas]MDF9892867.1 phenylacetate-CoA ligase [Pseudomonas vranovensis]KDO00873.1 AMP-binding protein [Pseudomonas donghuensis]MBF4210282.1 phenylacetate--CoA ligase [Pseudomonas donghuensis]MBS7600524.1 AMP-binding protein [Pseudomonas sp. RC2C2]MCP6694137.1 AMP-binding protein [Pseudomonas donghuensis]